VNSYEVQTNNQLYKCKIVRNDGVGRAIQSLTGTRKNFHFWQTLCNPRRGEFADTFTSTQSVRSAVKI